MGSLLAETIPLALAGAVSPILFVEVLAVISGPSRFQRGMAFAAGAAIPLIALATLMLLAGDAVSLPKSPTATAVIDIVLGAALLAFGASALFHAPREKKAAEPKQRSTDPNRTLLFGLTKVRDFFHRHSRRLRIVLGIGFGVWLLVKGIGELG